jgi:protein-S-isoprenylcysteine O-methyltransferase Ste14
VSPLPFTDTGPRIVFYAVLIAFVLLEQRTRVHSFRHREGERRDRGSLYLIIVCVATGFAGAGVIAGDAGAGDLSSARWPLFVAGIVLMIAGIVVRQWSVAMLGGSFTVVVRVREGQEVIDTGPYRYVRHPSYTGLLLTCAGYGLALGNWISLLCALLVPLAGTVVRIHVEERALLEGLGEPYRRFAQTRKRLVPRVW